MSRRLALLIGCSRYDDDKFPNLKAPAADVNGFADVLRNPEIGTFEAVKPLFDPEFKSARRAISTFYKRKRTEDLLLLYFAGHGVLDENSRLYLAVKDTERDQLNANGIEASFISAAIDDSRSRKTILILDCCYGGAFVRGSRAAIGTRVNTKEGFEGSGYGRYVLTATDSTSYAWEDNQIIGDIENSVFTHFLIQGLRTGEADRNDKGVITVTDLYNYVHDKVEAITKGKQTPLKWSYKEEGEIVIARNPRVGATLPFHSPEEIEDLAEGIRERATRKLEPLKSTRNGLEVQSSKRKLSTLDENLSLGRRQTVVFPEPIVWRRVDGGDVVIEYGEWQKDKDRDLYKVSDKKRFPISSFWMAKYPITNAEYQVFVDAEDGYQDEMWWAFSDPAAKWRKDNPEFEKTDYEGDDLPRTSVSWYDAIAYCRWLTAKTGLETTLPTEQQWQRSAIGDTGWVYPWGNKIDETRCNYARNVEKPTPVTQYDMGASPYGIYDLSGNVWEWTLTAWETGDNDELRTDDRRVVRGGSFFNYLVGVRAVSRFSVKPDNRNVDIGFRVVWTAPILP